METSKSSERIREERVLNNAMSTRNFLIPSLSFLLMSSILLVFNTNVLPSSLFETSGTIQYSQGNKAVLTSQDFVPLGDSSGLNHLPKSSRIQLRELYSAAGIKFARGHNYLRKQQLADISDQTMYVKPKKFIDMTAMQGLKMASKGLFSPGDEIRLPDSKEAVRRRRIQRALGETIAKYFSHQQKL